MRPAGTVSDGRKPELRLIFMATAQRATPRIKLTTIDRGVMVSDNDGIGSASNARSVETSSCTQSTCSIVGITKFLLMEEQMGFSYLFDSVCMSWSINY
jgi:hypothetical protein